LLNETYFNPRTRHSGSYYLSVLLLLAEGVRRGQPDRDIAANLTDKGLLSPTGKRWTANAVRQALFKLRNFREYPSQLHNALLQLVVDGLLKPPQVGVLLQPRQHSTM
jgi:hypothetical protein